MLLYGMVWQLRKRSSYRPSPRGCWPVPTHPLLHWWPVGKDYYSVMVQLSSIDHGGIPPI